LTRIKKRAKYHDATTLPPESLESGKVVGVIKRRGQRQHSSSYNVEFKCRIFKSLMLPVTDVVPFLVDSDTGLEPSTAEMDTNPTSRLLQRVTESEQGVCPGSDNEGVNVDLSNEDECVKIIADSDNFTWNRRKQGDSAFMEQCFEDEAPAVLNGEVTKDITLDWIEGGCLPEPPEKMKHTPGSLRKCRNFLANPELKKKEGHRRCFYAAIANFLVEQGETYDWEEQFGSKDNDVDVFQPEYDSDDEGGGLEDDAMDDQILQDLGVDCVTTDTGHGGPTSANGTLCQPVHHLCLNFGANVKRRAKICQVCEYEERGEVQSTLNVCLAHSARLCKKSHLPVADAGLTRIDDAEPVTDYSWVCPNSDWLYWNKFHNFYLQKGLWSHRAGLVNEKSQRLEFCCQQTSSVLNRKKNDTMGLEDNRGRKRGSKHL
jgi:hypothetical protein